MNTIDAQLLKEIFIAGAEALNEKKEYVNELNVFPVPDGDTGTNMTMTIQSAVREVEAVTEVTMSNICKAISSGSLRGARGNSGVILSQLLRGLTRQMREYNDIDIEILSASFEKAVETAYKAVMKPKEGTILTVARAGSDMAVYLARENLDIVTYVEAIVGHMRDVLDLTPEMLPVLKEAGVVDSGGEGLLIIIEGALNKLKEKYPALGGGELPDLTAFKKQSAAVKAYEPRQSQKAAKKEKSDKKTEKKEAKQSKEVKDVIQARPARRQVSKADISTADIKFGYCTEFIVNLETDFEDRDEAELKIFLEAVGDSIVVVADDDLVKVHVHTNMPGIALQKALTYGSLSKIKIDNMREEHNERLALDAEKQAGAGSANETVENNDTENMNSPAENESARDNIEDTERSDEYKAQETGPDVQAAQQSGYDEDARTSAGSHVNRAETGFIAVSAGEGLSEIFAGLGADIVIEGGQTMNPSTEDILNAIDQVNADNIFILPNNSNIILASQQASSLVEDKNIIVIPSKTIPQGIMALLNYMSNKSVEENEDTMLREMGNVKSGSVTYSIRDTVIQDVEIKQGDIMGISDAGIVNTGAQVLATTVELIDTLIDADSELVTLYYGKDTTEDEAGLIAASVKKNHPDVDVEVHYGGQPVYYYFVSVE
ncbi:MAG: DAK2 domain-containing protein [Lachnospiraceae bacterium]|nr:DAK2 domain-containing protein [Lachnospiraceae bacterium]